MTKIPNIKLIDNEEIEVYGYRCYEEAFLMRLVKSFSEKRKKILSFFALDDYEKVRINLFNNLEVLNRFSSQYITISPYHKGDCCGNMINYFCDDLLVDDYVKAGYIIASISHEFVHKVYHDTIKGNQCVWLEEGLATYLSGQKGFFELDKESYIRFIKKYILSAEVPEIEFLKVRGGKYGQFVDTETHQYDGYYFSYGIVRYLYEEKGYSFILSIIKDKNKLEAIEKNLMEHYMEYARKICCHKG